MPRFVSINEISNAGEIWIARINRMQKYKETAFGPNYYRALFIIACLQWWVINCIRVIQQAETNPENMQKFKSGGYVCKSLCQRDNRL